MRKIIILLSMLLILSSSVWSISAMPTDWNDVLYLYDFEDDYSNTADNGYSMSFTTSATDLSYDTDAQVGSKSLKCSGVSCGLATANEGRISEDFTLMFWYKTDSSDTGIIEKYDAGDGQFIINYGSVTADDIYHYHFITSGSTKIGHTFNTNGGGETWNHLAIVVNGRYVQHWKNGVEIEDYDYGVGYGETINWNLPIELFQNTKDYMMIDELSVFNSTISDEDIIIASEGSYSVPAIFENPTPYANLTYNTQQIINVSCSEGNSYLWFDTNSDPSTLINGGNQSSPFSWTTNVSESGTYYYKASCDGLENSSIYNVTWDFIFPSITFNSGDIDESNKSISKYLQNLTYDITYTDNMELYYYEINITDSSGNTNYYLSQIINGTEFNVSNLIDVSEWADGLYSFFSKWADSHTDEKIDKMKDIEYKPTEIKFKPNDNNEIIIECKDCIATTTTELTDRYEFNFNYPDFKNSRSYSVYSMMPIYYRADSGYGGHLITGMNWIDFVNDDAVSYDVKKKTDYEYEIKVYFNKSISEVKFKSIGDLNINNITLDFTLNAPGNITSYVPILESASENSSVLFNVTFDDSDDTSWSFRWILDGVTQAFTQAWTWTIDFFAYDIDNPHNVTIYINDSSGNIISNYWNMNISDTSINTQITFFDQSPINISWGDTIRLNCSIIKDYATTYDLNLQYRLPDSTTWIDVTESNDGDTYYYDLVTLIDTDWIGTFDFKCTFNDSLDVTGSETDLDSVNVYMGNLPPDTPTSISPNSGIYDTYIPLYCAGSDRNFDDLTYQFEADYYNITNQSTGWKLLANATDGSYDWYSLNLPNQENIAFRCRSYDGDYYSDWQNSSATTSIRHGTALQMFSITPANLYYPDIKLLFSLYCKIADEQNNTKITETWADCNADGQWDYVFDYNNLTTTPIKVMKDSFKCIYDENGNYSIIIGCLTERIDPDTKWDYNLCQDIKDDDNYCNIAKKYDVSINENPFKFN